MTSKRVGILGGGQLAQMLCEAGPRLGLQPLVLADDATDPALQLCPDGVVGGWKSPEALRRFLAQVDIVTFENEFVSCDELEAAAREFPEAEFRPSLNAIRRLQDKLNQKRLLQELKISTAPYLEFTRDRKELKEWIKEVLECFPEGAVFKWARLGYDGKGTYILPASKVSGGVPEALIVFCENALNRGVPLFAEKWVQFERELAIVASHSASGEFGAYPLVVSEQEGGICKRVFGPATSLGVRPELETQAQDFSRKIARAVPIHGTFAIEMFETSEGELWVNELAPRVHNTGHYSQDASATSQFENHLRAILGMPLGATASRPAFAMLNLLGPAGVQARNTGASLPEVPQSMHLHWYGKSELRPGRKLGHINATFSTAAELGKAAHELDQIEKAWIRKLGTSKKGDS